MQILRLAASDVVITDSVRREAQDEHSKHALASCAWLRRVADVPIPAPIADLDLGAGEKSVLAWALAHPGAEAILDDRVARRCALDLGLRVRGTFGLVLNAKKNGLIPAARPVAEELRGAGLYLSDKLMSQMLALVGE